MADETQSAASNQDEMSAVEALLVLLELARARTREATEHGDVQEAIRWRTVRALAQIAYDELPEEVKPNV